MTVSIIIAVKTWQNNLEECLSKCQELDFADFEILVLPDTQEGLSLIKGQSPLGTVPCKEWTIPIRIIPTGRVSPGQKRDIAMNYAKGEILAFIDDDAYPAGDWLKNAVKNFIDPKVAAVGGPSVTPQEDNLKQKASGLIYASILVSAQFIYRYLPKKKREVEDYPSCNFLVRKSIMQELGGFKTSFWPGEDTKLCLDIIQKLGKKIIYDPEVLVYHHRRSIFVPHLKQVANYALHRGYFVKKYPQTSLKVAYFIPTLLLSVIVMGGIASIFLIPLRIIYLCGLSLYLFLVFIFTVSWDLRLIPLVFCGTILTHLTYGFYFVKGLLSKRLKEEK